MSAADYSANDPWPTKFQLKRPFRVGTHRMDLDGGPVLVDDLLIVIETKEIVKVRNIDPIAVERDWNLRTPWWRRLRARKRSHVLVIGNLRGATPTGDGFTR